MKVKVTSKEIFILILYFTRASCFFKVFPEETSPKTCQTDSGVSGVCVDMNKCPLFNDVIEKNSLSQFLKMAGSICSIGVFGLSVCCPEEKNKINDLLYPPNCGVSNAIHNRVVGGSPAVKNAWPWMVALTIDYGDGPDENEFVCGASLISKRHVLTAAHCLEFEEVKYVAYLGLLNLDKKNESVRIEVDRYTVHPEYNSTNHMNDIAIITLKDEVEFSKTIKPICLPLKPEIRDRDFVKNMPFVAGWGATKYNGPTSNILLETQVPVVTNSECKESYKNKKHVSISNNTICAGYPNGGKDACLGDSGGPLMFPLKGSYYLIGIVSTGFKCAEPGYPGIYTRVTSYLDFILDNLK